jgi:phage repressor protein C with HTH and peptisase S24 domain
MALAGRIVDIRTALSLSQSDMADKVGIPFRTWQAYERGERTPPATLFEKLYAIGVDANWLTAGVGAMFRGDSKPVDDDADLVRIPRYDVRVGAGANGGYAVEETPAGFVAFEAEWVRSTLHCDPKDLLIADASGDSMVPTIFDGDKLVINKSDKELSPDSIYVFRLDDTLHVKRIQRKLSGDISLIADNTAYPTETLTKEQVETLSVIGRVVLPIHKL